MEVTFLGGASEVGASCTLLQVAGHRLLIDGGMRPAAREGQPRLPDLSLLDATPPEALLLSAPEQGTCTMVSDQWKPGVRPMPLIQLVPGIRRGDLLAVSPEDAKQKLAEWKRAIEQEWVDLLAWWSACQGKPFTYAEVCAQLATDELRLAWSIELLARGASLFQRRGMSWLPVEADKVRSDPGLARHLDLLEAGAGTPVVVNGQRARLTGRSTWRLFEVAWEDGEQAGERSGVRVANIVIQE